MPRTAIIARSTLQLTKITVLSKGREMAANLGDIRMINIYAPSGTWRKAERKTFVTVS
jgi:exonuclease III